MISVNIHRVECSILQTPPSQSEYQGITNLMVDYLIQRGRLHNLARWIT